MHSPGLILLAAGGSSRMGQPKQLMPWKGNTLLRHACATSLATSFRPVVVVLGCEAEKCRRELFDLEVVSVINEKWQRGLGTSIATGIAAIEIHKPETPAALIMLVDQPAITPEFLTLLLLTWQQSPDKIVATQYPNGAGVPALLPRRYFAELRALDGDRGARALIAQEKSHVISLTPNIPLVDLDTLEIYKLHS
jgi:molybdenum cofactor cytidylyltransferase